MKKLKIRFALVSAALWFGAWVVLFSVHLAGTSRGGGDPAPYRLALDLAGAVVGFSAFFGLSQWLFSNLLFRPLCRIAQAIRLLEAGAPGTAPSVEGLGDFASILEAAARRRAAVGAEVSDLASQLLEKGAQIQQGLAQVREGLELGRGAMDVARRSADQLNATVEQTRGALNNIASSTSDNSTSLIEMSASVDEVASSSDELAQQVAGTAASVLEMVRSIGEVADRVEMLARETDLTAASMAQIDSSTRQIEQNAREAAGLSGRMAETAREGSLAVQETLQGIHASHEVMQETARAMGELSTASKAIDGVVKIINDINDKTKLLSLNAAIIAAQAGDHGKSFAVVAHEIKNLSDRTAASTGEISRIVRGIRDRMIAATESVGRGQRATGQSVELAERAGRTLERILSTAQVSNEMTREILRATEEQSRGSQSVMASMQEVSGMVSYIRQAGGEHRASAERVTGSTEVMSRLTEHVKLATAEQAEVSRYISEAIAASDQNLQELLAVMRREREEAETILDQIGNLAKCWNGQESGARDVEAALTEFDRQIEVLQSRAAPFVGPEASS